jgi:hypothetical protein
MRNSRLFSNDQHGLLLIVVMLTGHYLLKNISSEINLSYEFVSMAASRTMECSLTVDRWTPLPRCLYSLLGWILKYPPLYFLCVVSLFSAKLIILYLIFVSLNCQIVQKRNLSLVALVCLFLVTIGGLGRFFIGSMGVLSHFDTTLRTVGQIFILLGSLYFIRRRFILSAGFFAPALLTAATSTLSIIAILGISLLVSLRKFELKAVIVGGIICVSTIVFQYWSVTESTLNEATHLDPSLVSLNEWKMFKSEGSRSINDWSTAYHFNDQLGFFYISFVFVTLLVVFPALISKNKQKLSIRSHTPIVIISASIVYFAIAYFVEVFETPNFLAEWLMAICPRRVLYFPILACVAVLANYIVCFLFDPHYRTPVQLIIISVLILFLSVFLYLTNGVYGSEIPGAVIILSSVLALSIICVLYRWPWFLRTAITQRSVYITLLIGVILKTIPLISIASLQNGKDLYFSSLSRSYEQTAVLENLQQSGQELVRISSWLNSSTLANDPVLLVNVGKDTQYRLQALTGRTFYTLDLFAICGLTCFFDKGSYVQTKQYFENIFDIRWDEKFLSLDRNERQKIINNALPGIIASDRLRTIDQRIPRFIVSNEIILDKPMVYYFQDYYVYEYSQ